MVILSLTKPSSSPVTRNMGTMQARHHISQDEFMYDICDGTTCIELAIHGGNYIIKGTLLIAPPDTLASTWLGELKEGVSFALKTCRRLHGAFSYSNVTVWATSPSLVYDY